MSEARVGKWAPKELLWNLDLPTLNENGAVIKGGMWPSQRRWWDLPNYIKLYIGGYGAGKTRILCMRMIALALHNAPAPVAMVSPSFSMAQETTILTTRELLAGKQDYVRSKKVAFDYTERKSSPHEFQIFTRGRIGRILVYSGQDPHKLKGPNLAAVGIDEPFIQEYAVFEQMLARVRHPFSRKREINLTGTPEQLNWGFDLAEGDLRDKFDVGLVTSSTIENKALPAEYVKTLLDGMDPRAAEAYVHGRFMNLCKGLVYYSFDRRENVVQLARPEIAWVGSGMDFNVDPMAATVFWYDPQRHHMHYFAEYELPNSDTEEMCALLQQKHWEDGLRKVFPDASGRTRSTKAPVGRTDYKIIEEAGFEICARREGNPLQRDRYNSVNSRLRGRDGVIKITIDPSCKRLIKYLSLYNHELMLKPNQKAMSHLLDAFSYPPAYLFPVDKRTLNQLRIRGY